MKYDDAFCETDKGIYTPESVAYIFNNDSERYAKNFDRKLFCPDCRKVPLSFVNGSRPFFRGYPNVDHAEDCLYKKDEMDSIEVRKLHDSPAGESEIVHQIDRLVIQFLRDNVGELDLDSRINRRRMNNTGLDIPKTKWQCDKFIPRKQLGRPFTDEDYGVEKLFYGRVHIKWEEVKDDTRRKILIQGINTKRLICKLYVSEKVYMHLPSKSKNDRECDAFVVFLATLTRANSKSTWSRGNLVRSTYLSVNVLSR